MPDLQLPQVPWWVVLIVAAVLALGWYLSYTAARLDRMHQRVAATAAALDAALLRRAEAVLGLARDGAWDPATRVLMAGAAAEMLDGAPGWSEARAAAESRFSATLRHLLAEAGAGDHAHFHRVRLAQNGALASAALHRQAITETREMRHQTMVRVFHLAGHAPMPQHIDVDLDVTLPAG